MHALVNGLTSEDSVHEFFLLPHGS
jgi:hypothetical protein